MTVDRLTRLITVAVAIIVVAPTYWLGRALGQQFQEQVITGSDTLPQDGFGLVVAIDRDTAVITTMASQQTGCAYVFVRTGEVWEEQQKLCATVMTNTGTAYGQALALSGNTVLVGAWADDSMGTNSGAVYLFARSGTSWSLPQKLTAPDATDYTLFGSSLAIDGDTAVICGNSACYVYTGNGSNWTFQKKLTVPQYVQAVGISGDTIVMGSKTEEAAGVHVFVGSGNNWAEQTILTGSGGPPPQFGFFGGVARIHSNTVVVGSALEDYVFVREGSNWFLQDKLAPIFPTDVDFVPGGGIDVHGDTIVTSAASEIYPQGVVWFFKRNGNTWTQAGKIVGDPQEDVEGFGVSVALDSQTAIVGALYNNLAGYRAGAAHLYKLPDEAIHVVALEAVQTIQDWNNSVPLISNKVTYVRAHLQYNGDPQGVSAKLRGFRDGVELPGSPLSDVAGFPVFTTNSASLVRTNWGLSTDTRSLNFALPQSWRYGTVDLQLEPVCEGCASSFTCDSPLQPGSAIDSCKTQVSFQSMPPFLVKFVIIEPQGDTGSVPTVLPTNTVLSIARRITATYPVDTVHYTDETLSLPDASVGNVSEVLSALQSRRLLDGCTGGPQCRRLYYGIDVDLTAGDAGDISSTCSCGPLSTGFNYARNIASHELGHCLGIEHAVNQGRFGVRPSIGGAVKKGACCEGASTYAPEFPFFSNEVGAESVCSQFRAVLGPLDLGDRQMIFGLDTNQIGDSNTDPDGGPVIDPKKHFELMSYCGLTNNRFKWPSSFTYSNLIAQITSRFSSSPAPLRFTTTNQSDFLVVRGAIDLATDVVSLHPFVQFSTPNALPLPNPGDYTLELFDAASNVLTQVSFQPELRAENDTTAGTFLITVPADPAIHSAVIRHGTTVVASRSASPAAPTVQIQSPNGGELINTDTVTVQWTSADSDGDALHHIVQYSADGGTTWQTLAMNLAGQSFSVKRIQLGGSSNAMFRVFASDGFYTASDASDALFTIPNNNAELVIVTPSESQMFIGTQPIFFEAFALDREDGELTGHRQQWTSDLDGPLGEGTEVFLPADQLSEGTHLISVTATDNGGLATTASVHVVISRQPPAALADLTTTAITAPEVTTAGQDLIYDITVRNQGRDLAPGVVLTDTVSPGIPVVSALASQGNCSIIANTILCNLGDLNRGASANATIVLKPTATGSVTNDATAVSPATDPVPANNSVVIVTAVTPAVVPLGPSSLAAVTRSTTTVKLTWTDNSDNEDRFIIKRGTSPTGPFAAIAEVASNVTAYVDSGLTAGTYFYRIRAGKGSVLSKLSGKASATVLDPAPIVAPAAPTGLQVIGTTTKAVSLAWTDNADNENGFKILRSSDAVTYKLVGSIGADRPWFTDKSVTPGSAYYYKVRAYNFGGSSAASNIANVTTSP